MIVCYLFEVWDFRVEQEVKFSCHMSTVWSKILDIELLQ